MIEHSLPSNSPNVAQGRVGEGSYQQKKTRICSAWSLAFQSETRHFEECTRANDKATDLDSETRIRTLE